VVQLCANSRSLYLENSASSSWDATFAQKLNVATFNLQGELLKLRIKHSTLQWCRVHRRFKVTGKKIRVRLHKHSLMQICEQVAGGHADMGGHGALANSCCKATDQLRRGHVITHDYELHWSTSYLSGGKYCSPITTAPANISVPNLALRWVVLRKVQMVKCRFRTCMYLPNHKKRKKDPLSGQR
jgi:hypothetical protein